MNKCSEQLAELIRSVQPEVVNLRHRIHEEPELCYEERATARKVVDFLDDVPGVDIRMGVAGTGVVAVLGRGKPGRCVALRADMDALPIEEKTGCAYASKKPGLMHACGHDGHTAILAGTVKVLSAMQDQLKGPVKFIFQPAEEGGGGGRRMVDDGALKDPEVHAIYALHGWPDVEIGNVGYGYGGIMASTDSFTIRVKGHGGHAAIPQKVVDPVVIAAHLIVALQTVVSRNTDPVEGSVLSICKLEGGSAFNVIPNEVSMLGTLRTLNEAVRQRCLSRMHAIVQHVAEAFGGSAELIYREECYPVCHNTDAEVDFFKDVMARWVGPEQMVKMPPSMGGEDFAFYTHHVPAMFWMLGVKARGSDKWPQLHQPDYDFNDDAIPFGIRGHCEMVLAFQDRTG